MVKSKQISKLVLIFVLVFPVISYANNDNEKVAKWAQEVLLYTLTIDYTTTPDELAKRRRNFLPVAWNAFRSFIGNRVQVIRDKKLSLHPRPLSSPRVAAEGLFSGIQYWQIDQIIYIPELSLNIYFALLIIKTNGPPFVVQSMSVTIL